MHFVFLQKLQREFTAPAATAVWAVDVNGKAEEKTKAALSSSGEGEDLGKPSHLFGGAHGADMWFNEKRTYVSASRW